MTLNTVRNAQIEVLKRAIARRHAELLEETREDVGRDLGQAEISRDVRELEKLEAALARIDEGTFGRCIECGAEIAFKRLAVYPVATRCAGCQGIYERDLQSSWRGETVEDSS